MAQQKNRLSTNSSFYNDMFDSVGEDKPRRNGRKNEQNSPKKKISPRNGLSKKDRYME